MINQYQYELNEKERNLVRARGKWYRERKERYVEQFNNRIRKRKNHKVWELERTEEGYTQIRKVRL